MGSSFQMFRKIKIRMKTQKFEIIKHLMRVQNTFRYMFGV